MHFFCVDENAVDRIFPAPDVGKSFIGPLVAPCWRKMALNLGVAIGDGWRDRSRVQPSGKALYRCSRFADWFMI